MEQFYEPPQLNSRRDLAVLFTSLNQNASRENLPEQFVPFAQERDKLGRLISREGRGRASHSLSSQLLKKRYSNPEVVTERGKISDQVVERIFKLREVKEFKSSKDISRMRILSTSSRDKMVTPVVGQYDVAAVADKIKYRKFNLIALTQPKPSQPLPKHQSTDLAPKRPKKPPMNEQPHPLSKLKEAPLPMNFDLPQLQKYHEMKKLKMKHYDNFEESHSKFKQLARHSLVLANQIKKGLQLD